MNLFESIYSYLSDHYPALHEPDRSHVAASLVRSEVLDKRLRLKSGSPIPLEVGFVGNGSGAFNGSIDVKLYEP